MTDLMAEARDLDLEPAAVDIARRGLMTVRESMRAMPFGYQNIMTIEGCGYYVPAADGGQKALIFADGPRDAGRFLWTDCWNMVAVIGDQFWLRAPYDTFEDVTRGRYETAAPYLGQFPESGPVMIRKHPLDWFLSGCDGVCFLR